MEIYTYAQTYCNAVLLNNDDIDNRSNTRWNKKKQSNKINPNEKEDIFLKQRLGQCYFGCSKFSFIL